MSADRIAGSELLRAVAAWSTDGDQFAEVEVNCSASAAGRVDVAAALRHPKVTMLVAALATVPGRISEDP